MGEDCFYDAVQQRNLSWEGFCEETADIHRLASFAPAFAKMKVRSLFPFMSWMRQKVRNQSIRLPGSFLPVEPQFPLNYDGNLFAIDRITVTGDEDSEMSGGLFSHKNLSVFGLKLRCPEIQVSGLACAGALIGTGGADTRIQLKKCYAIQYPSVHASGEKAMTSTAPVDAGGLIGSFSGAELSIEGVVVEDSFLTKKEKNAPERTVAAEAGNGTDGDREAGSGKTALNRRTMRKRRLGSIRHPEMQEDLSAASLLVSSASSAVPPLSMWTAETTRADFSEVS